MKQEIPKPLRNALARQVVGDVHPSPDVLTSFMERTLPALESEVVVHHLAQCAECREIVFLASEAAEDEVREERLVATAAANQVAPKPGYVASSRPAGAPADRSGPQVDHADAMGNGDCGGRVGRCRSAGAATLARRQRTQRRADHGRRQSSGTCNPGDAANCDRSKSAGSARAAFGSRDPPQSGAARDNRRPYAESILRQPQLGAMPAMNPRAPLKLALLCPRRAHHQLLP